MLNSRLPWREAKYVGSYSGVPQQPWQVYLHLIWKVGRVGTPLPACIPCVARMAAGWAHLCAGQGLLRLHV